MKTLISLFFTVFFFASTFAQDMGINYKALIRDDNGNIVANQTIDIYVRILEEDAASYTYSERHMPTTDANGIVILNIGEGTVGNGDYNAIDWGSTPYFLQTAIDIDNDGNYSVFTTPFKAVPYALHAKTATTALNAGATSIDGLSDGKTDASSLFLGLDAGANDDGTTNYNVGIGRQALYSNTSGYFNTAIGYTALFDNTTGNGNTANGFQALYYNTTGSNNTANGLAALGSNTTGDSNTANGYQALYNNTTGNNNTANGYRTLFSNTTGGNNTANGRSALFSNTTGHSNTANGYQALYNNTTGNNNTANGYRTLFSNTTGGSNTANGLTALSSNTTGDNNTANGRSALQSNTTGHSNTANGRSALSSNTTGGNNTANGYLALNKNTIGNFNTANGYQALSSNTTGNSNTANGVSALYSNTTGGSNTANGYQALNSNTTGGSNTANGYRALFSNTTGHSNTANGYQALNKNTTGDYNTANGYQALNSNTTGSSNTANGFEALNNNTTGYSNTANGNLALKFNTTGDNNTANGISALRGNTTGVSNTANGRSALQLNTTGNNNTANGYEALLANSSGSGNVALGYKAGFGETGSNTLYIANSSTSTPLIFGEFDFKTLTLNSKTTMRSTIATEPDLVLGGNSSSGDNGFITSDPQFPSSDIVIRSNDAVAIQLDNDNNENGHFQVIAGDGSLAFQVSETGTVTANGSVVHSSDRRLKKDITDLPYGLKEILQLQPKAYNWKSREQAHKSLGLIAQDVQPILKEIVTARDDEAKTLGISYTELIPVLINAIKEQSQQIDDLKATINNLQTTQAKKIERLETLMVKLEN